MTAAGKLTAALDAAGRGWHVFPIAAGQKRPPRPSDWEHRATLDVGRIERWWTAHPADNVGIACGPSGLVVVDLDVPKPGERPPAEWAGAAGGADVLAGLAEHHRATLPATFTVRTAGGGWHLYYRAPAGAELRNSAGRIGWRIDTRAAGGYVVAAGSTVGRRAYSVTDETPPAVLPAWIGRLAGPPAPAASSGPAGGRGRPPSARRGYVTAAVEGEVRRVLDAGPGARNRALNAAGWNLGRHVAAGNLPAAAVEDTLVEAAVAAGYRDGPAAARAVVRAALAARLRRAAG